MLSVPAHGNHSAERAEVVDLLPRLLLGNQVGYVSCIAVRRHALVAVADRRPLAPASPLPPERDRREGPLLRQSRTTWAVTPNVAFVDGERVLAGAAEVYRGVLGDRLVAAYALGSLAHGGFSALVSDIDLGLIVSDPPEPGDAEMIEAVAARVRSKGSTLHQRLSVFWATPSVLRGEQDGGRFPALDRLDLIENGRLLLGSDVPRSGLPRPNAVELLATGAEFALANYADANAIAELRSPELLLSRGVRRLTKLVLFPVRFIHTAATGQVGTNAAAVGRYLEDDRAPSARLVRAALGWRTAPPTDQAAAADLLGSEMLPLYLFYLDDHIERLHSAGELVLTDAFREWRSRLAG